MNARGKGWLAAEVARLILLRELHGLSWSEISEQIPGRSANSCSIAYYKRHTHRRQREAKHLVAGIEQMIGMQRLAAASPPLAPRSPGPPPSPTVVATARLVLDAELRNRIAERGITGGLLGDPPPGRSALDEKRAGREHVAAPDRRGLRLPPRPTLSSGFVP
jgi:hypothetical protein